MSSGPSERAKAWAAEYLYNEFGERPAFKRMALAFDAGQLAALRETLAMMERPHYNDQHTFRREIKERIADLDGKPYEQRT